jgi:hypothetical protein
MLEIKLAKEIRTTTTRSAEIHHGPPTTKKSKRSLSLFNSKFLNKLHSHQSSIQDSPQEGNLQLLSDQIIEIWNLFQYLKPFML